MRCSDFRRDDHWIELREKHTQSDRPRLETAEIGPTLKSLPRHRILEAEA